MVLSQLNDGVITSREKNERERSSRLYIGGTARNLADLKTKGLLLA